MWRGDVAEMRVWLCVLLSWCAGVCVVTGRPPDASLLSDEALKLEGSTSLSDAAMKTEFTSICSRKQQFENEPVEHLLNLLTDTKQEFHIL